MLILPTSLCETMSYEATRQVKTSMRTFDIIEQLASDGKTGVSALATDLDMSKGIVHNHLSTLRERGYVRKVGGEYQLTAKLLSVGVQARSQSALYQYAGGLMRDLADRFDVGVVLCQHAENACIVIDAYQIPSMLELDVRTVLARRESIVGLVTCAESEEVDDTAEYDIGQVRNSLDRDGYAIGPLSPGTTVNCVAIPIADDSGEWRGSVGVLLPDSNQNKRVPRIIESTITLRDQIERRFQSGWTDERSFTTEKHSWVGE